MRKRWLLLTTLLAGFLTGSEVRHQIQIEVSLELRQVGILSLLSLLVIWLAADRFLS